MAVCVGVVVLVGLNSNVSVGVGVDVFVGVIVSVGVLVTVLVLVVVGVIVRVRVSVGVGVMVFDGVLVCVGVRVTVRVGVSVAVRVMVGVGVRVALAVEEGAAVWVLGLGVLVGVFRMKEYLVGVRVRVGRMVRVGVLLPRGVALAVGSGVSVLNTAFKVLLGEGINVLVCKPSLVGVRVCFDIERSDPISNSFKKGRLTPEMIPVNLNIKNRTTIAANPSQIHLLRKTLLVRGGATRIALGTPPSQPLMNPGQSTWGSRIHRLR